MSCLNINNFTALTVFKKHRRVRSARSLLYLFFCQKKVWIVILHVCEKWVYFLFLQEHRSLSSPSSPPSLSLSFRLWWGCKTGPVSLPQPDRLINYPDLLFFSLLSQLLCNWVCGPYTCVLEETARVCVWVCAWGNYSGLQPCHHFILEKLCYMLMPPL